MQKSSWNKAFLECSKPTTEKAILDVFNNAGSLVNDRRCDLHLSEGIFARQINGTFVASFSNIISTVENGMAKNKHFWCNSKHFLFYVKRRHSSINIPIMVQMSKQQAPITDVTIIMWGIK